LVYPPKIQKDKFLFFDLVFLTIRIPVCGISQKNERETAGKPGYLTSAGNGVKD
jgi:hypothetical protein